MITLSPLPLIIGYELATTVMNDREPIHSANIPLKNVNNVTLPAHFYSV